MPTGINVSDEIIGEVVARQGGYEEVERAGNWTQIAAAIGLHKDQGANIKLRYEDMLMASADLDQQEEEEEEEEFEVEDILDSRTDTQGNVQYLVKWKDAIADDQGDDMTWEPREHLACPELLEQFEDHRRRQQRSDITNMAKVSATSIPLKPEQVAVDMVGITTDEHVISAATGCQIGERAMKRQNIDSRVEGAQSAAARPLEHRGRLVEDDTAINGEVVSVDINGNAVASKNVR